MDIESELMPIFDEYYDPQILTQPRVPRYFPPVEKQKRVWNFHNSIFKKWKKDTEVRNTFLKA